MIERYLLILHDGLDKKKDILNAIIAQNEIQEEALRTTPDWDAFENAIAKKEFYIQEILKLDEGFDGIYERIKAALADSNSLTLHQQNIRVLQNKIREVTDLGVKVEVSEKRNKIRVEQIFRDEKNKLKQGMRSTKVATDYYKTMSQLNFVDPQLMDQKH